LNPARLIKEEVKAKDLREWFKPSLKMPVESKRPNIIQLAPDNITIFNSQNVYRKFLTLPVTPVTIKAEFARLVCKSMPTGKLTLVTTPYSMDVTDGTQLLSSAALPEAFFNPDLSDVTSLIYKGCISVNKQWFNELLEGEAKSMHLTGCPEHVWASRDVLKWVQYVFADVDAVSLKYMLDPNVFKIKFEAGGKYIINAGFGRPSK
jgi:hypothetical protein